MTQAIWFVMGSNGNVEGPFPMDAIGRAIRERKLSSSIRVSPNADPTTWVPITSVDAFAAVFREMATFSLTPTPPPPFAFSGYVSPPPPPPTGAPPMQMESPATPVALPSVPSGSTPSARPPTGSPTRGTGQKRVLLMVSAVVGMLLLSGILLATVGRQPPDDTRVRQAMVHIVAGNSRGAGFFVAGPPDGYAYVVTAYHVISSGDPVQVERMAEVSDKKSYVEAYPSTEVVAVDLDADLAVIRLKEVQASKFARLPLAKRPEKDTKIVAHGFPSSNLGKLDSSISQDGKINSLTKFPVLDRVSNKVVRANAIDGIIISAAIQPGFSGGPCVNMSGEVVGVNVLMDREHTQQNGAISVEVVAKLIGSLKPAAEPLAPTQEEVRVLLTRIEKDYLKHPIEDRMEVREAQFVSSDDLPAVRKSALEVSTMWHDQTPDEQKMSPRAWLGIIFAGLSGTPLETYRSKAVTDALAACPKQALSLFRSGKDNGQPAQRIDDCDGYASRALAWDLTANVLQWEGSEHDFVISSVERVNDESHAFKATASTKGSSSSFPVWVSNEQGLLRLKLFDDAGKPYGIHAHGSTAAESFRGTWSYSGTKQRFTPKYPIDAKLTETLDVNVGTDGAAEVKHRFVRDIYIVPGKVWPCSRRGVMQVGVEQNFKGTLENGVIHLTPMSVTSDGAPVVGPAGDDATKCAKERDELVSYTPDRRIILKFIAGRFVMYRTDGSLFPESVEFKR
jgi:S1-C subfamily serine protease